MKIGENTAKYLVGLKKGGLGGILEVAAGLQDDRTKHKRKKDLKRTPTTRNYNIKTSGASNGAKAINIWHSETTESGKVND
tara:strand:+ start:261 stop:503 length:243 start_codon:yes stop_codon:yes gene_type:complete